jgi:hypothetical protein
VLSRIYILVLVVSTVIVLLKMIYVIPLWNALVFPAYHLRLQKILEDSYGHSTTDHQQHTWWSVL